MTMDERKDPRKPTALQIRFKSATIAEFVEKHAKDISRGGMFIKMKSPFDPGTLIKFEVRITEESAIYGVGRVAWCRHEPKPGEPPGMGIKFIKIEDKSIPILEAILAEKDNLPGKTEELRFDDPLPKPKLPVPAVPSSIPSSARPSGSGLPKPSFPIPNRAAVERTTVPAPARPSLQRPTPESTSGAKLPPPRASIADKPIPRTKPSLPTPKAEPPKVEPKVEPRVEPKVEAKIAPKVEPEVESKEAGRIAPKAGPAKASIPRRAAQDGNDELLNLSMSPGTSTGDGVFLSGTKDDFAADIDSALDNALGDPLDRDGEVDTRPAPALQKSEQPKPKEPAAPNKPEQKFEQAALKRSPGKPAGKPADNPVPDTILPDMSYDPSPKRKSDWAVVLVIIVVLLAAAGGGAWYFLSHRAAPADDAPTQTPPPMEIKSEPPAPVMQAEPADTGHSDTSPNEGTAPPDGSEAPSAASAAADSPTSGDTTEAVESTLSVLSIPKDATVYINGKFQGRTPMMMGGQPVGKAFDIKIKKWGHKSYFSSVTPTEASTVVSVSLKSVSKKVSVDSAPGGANVWIDGKELGRTPVRLAKESYAPNLTVKIIKDGYVPIERTVSEADWTEEDGLYLLFVAVNLEKLPDSVGTSKPSGKTDTPQPAGESESAPKPESEATPKAEPSPKVEPAAEPAPKADLEVPIVESDLAPVPMPAPKVEPSPKPEPKPEDKPESPPPPPPENKESEGDKGAIEENPF